MMPYITAFSCSDQGDRPDVIPDGCVKLRLPGPVCRHPPGHRFHHRVLRTHRHGGRLYGLLGGEPGGARGVGSVYDIRELLHSTVCLMDGRSPLEVSLPGPLELLKKPLLKAIRGTVIEKVLRDQDVLRDGM